VQNSVIVVLTHKTRRVTTSVGQLLVHLVIFSELHCFSAINCCQFVGSPTLSAVQCKKFVTEKTLSAVQCYVINMLVQHLNSLHFTVQH
jgi:hypothetical protein